MLNFKKKHKEVKCSECGSVMYCPKCDSIICPICNNSVFEVESQEKINKKYAKYEFWRGGWSNTYIVIEEKSHDLAILYKCSICGHLHKIIKKDVSSRPYDDDCKYLRDASYEEYMEKNKKKG